MTVRVSILEEQRNTSEKIQAEPVSEVRDGYNGDRDIDGRKGSGRRVGTKKQELDEPERI